jgi:hypothetical protein
MRRWRSVVLEIPQKQYRSNKKYFVLTHIVSIEMLWLWPRVISAHKQAVLLTPEDTPNALNAMAFNMGVGSIASSPSQGCRIELLLPLKIWLSVS